MRQPLSFLFFTFYSSFSLAQLEPLNDLQLAKSAGQAAITIDKHTLNGLNYTRVDLGLEIKTSIIADKVELGRYSRNGESQPADILIENFALGAINDSGNMEPFEIRNPYIEYATNSSGTIEGFRLGFGQARGSLSGDIKSLTGSVDIKIEDNTSNLHHAVEGDNAGTIGTFLGLVTSFLTNGAPLSANAGLVHGPDSSSSGEPDLVRASYVGVANGFAININDVPFLSQLALRPTAAILPGVSCSGGICRTLVMSADDCSFVGGIQACFPLSDFKSLEIGDGNGGFNSGTFLSAQKQGVAWKDGNTVTATQSGFFMNIPNAGIVVTLEEATQGISRERTHYHNSPYYE